MLESIETNRNLRPSALFIASRFDLVLHGAATRSTISERHPSGGEELRTAVDAVVGPNEQVELRQRVRRALARVAHANPARLI